MLSTKATDRPCCRSKEGLSERGQLGGQGPAQDPLGVTLFASGRVGKQRN